MLCPQTGIIHWDRTSTPLGYGEYCGTLLFLLDIFFAILSGVIWILLGMWGGIDPFVSSPSATKTCLVCKTVERLRVRSGLSHVYNAREKILASGGRIRQNLEVLTGCFSYVEVFFDRAPSRFTHTGS